MHAQRHPNSSSTSKPRGVLSRAPRTRSVVAATGLLVICVAPFANARTGGPLREGVRNGTTTAETQVISNIGSSLSPTGGYSTRQSNLSGSGGGAVYGCRSAVGGSAAKPRPQNPCLRANNLNTGYAFEFHASDGPITGLISAGAGGDTKKPFVTNATGVATGLNADRLDNLDAAQIVAAARVKTGLDADTLDGVDSSGRAGPLRAGDHRRDRRRGRTRGVPRTRPWTISAGERLRRHVHGRPDQVRRLRDDHRRHDGGEITATPAASPSDVTTVDRAHVRLRRRGMPTAAFHLTVNC